jgi:hypothetical protein
MIGTLLGIGIFLALVIIAIELYDIDKEMHLIEKDLKHYKRRIK